ncbi:Hypothetical protein PBC10988_17310 [Planctomycetales bacterium 10988]|nr:Hypothetical protein PBC10988_17310 [Planctomycetales bacterium 10988]
MKPDPIDSDPPNREDTSAKDGVSNHPEISASIEVIRKKATSPLSDLDEKEKKDKPLEAAAGASPTGTLLLPAIYPDMQKPDQMPAEQLAIQLQLAEIQKRLHQTRGQSHSKAVEIAEELTRCEHEVLELSHQAEQLDPLHTQQLGYPVLDDLTQWRNELRRLDLGEAADDTEQVLIRLLEDDFARWKEHVEKSYQNWNADQCFSALIQARIFEFDTSLRCPHHQFSQDAAQELREELRTRLKELVEKAATSPRPIPEEKRAQWVTDLLDRSDLVLTNIDDLPPQQATTQLNAIYEDVQWHYDEIETERGSQRRRLRRKLRRLDAQWQERTLQWRLEKRFGTLPVAWSERIIMVLICLVLIIITVQFWDLSPQAVLWLEIADAAICSVLLTEFFVKLSFAPKKRSWFWRHFLIDLIPSIPVGLLVVFYPPTTEAADSLRATRFIRLLRLSTLARYVRILRPFLRMLRAFGFLTRGMDRLVRRYGSLLNRNIILYPTREERQLGRLSQASLAPMIRSVRSELDQRWRHLIRSSDGETKHKIAEMRIHSLDDDRKEGLTKRPPQQSVQSPHARTLTAEELLDRLGTTTPQGVESELNEELIDRLARSIRLFSRPPLSWMPLIHGQIPRVTSQMTNAEVVAAAARRMSSTMRWYHHLWFWAADLYGTVTPSQFVDRIGTMLVKGSSSPAMRLLMFGGIYLIVRAALIVIEWLYAPEAAANAIVQGGEALRSLTENEMPPLLTWVDQFVSRYVGPTLLLLGGVCLIFLGLGMWFKHLAREATDFLESSAHAQFLALTENIRSRHLLRDAGILYQRVLGPEWEIQDAEQEVNHKQNLSRFITRTRQSLLGSEVAKDTKTTFDATERMLLLYRDALDGAVLADSDTRTSSQLLGNPALQQLFHHSDRIKQKEYRALRALDLRRQQTLVGGPYLWFNFICQAVAQSTARVMIDYNRNAIPLEELSLVTRAERARYDRWLGTDSATTSQVPGEEDLDKAGEAITSTFTVMHFLDAHPLRDLEIQRRFGDAVLSRMQLDRQWLIRRVFGTFPLHRLPKEQRVLNLYALYEAWFARGRVLLLPCYVMVLFFQSMIKFLGWLWVCVKELINPQQRVDQSDAADADFTTCVRKIDRMRGPITVATIRLRMLFDPEYLGVSIPGIIPREELSKQADLENDLQDDLDFLTPDPDLQDTAHRQQQRAIDDMERLSDLQEEGLWNRLASRMGVPVQRLQQRQTSRAAAVAYLGNFRGIRSLLSAEEILKETFAEAQRDDPMPNRWFTGWLMMADFRRFWKQHGSGDANARLAAWRAILHDKNGSAEALKVWRRYGQSAQSEGERRLANLLHHPGRISEQLVTLRTVQTLAMLDVLTYREHIYRLGNYAAAGDVPGKLLRWSGAGEG